METFGFLLSKYRRQCLDPQRGGMLTQERLADLLEHEAGIPTYTGTRISNWERGQEIIRQDNRALLVGLIAILRRYGGLASLAEANSFLFAGGYRQLNDQEIQQINPPWQEQAKSQATRTHNEPTTSPRPRSLLASVADNARQWLSQLGGKPTDNIFRLHAPTCGDRGINLGSQRLLVSTTFGSYFTGLLERQHNYIELPGQIIAPVSKTQEQLTPIERIYWTLQYAKGSRQLIIAAEGGMGKSTLAAKIVRCLFQEQAIDMILGDSAKNKQVNPITGDIIDVEPGYADIASFYNRLCDQLGLPYEPGLSHAPQILTNIRDRLLGRRAVIIVDNLESLTQGSALFHALNTLTSRDVRAIITTRIVAGFNTRSTNTMVVPLRPLTDITDVQTFASWHIHHHHNEHPGLTNLTPDLVNKKRLHLLFERTGGNPLLLQLILSDAARYSWEYVERLPQMFGHALLNFLYEARWQELKKAGYAGMMSCQLLDWLAGEQYQGRKVSLDRLVQWGEHQTKPEFFAESLRLLHERFLVVNHDPKVGNFALFPSLIEFLHQQE